MSAPADKKRRVVFFGTSDFAVPVLESLARAEDFEVALVVTQPDRPVGRKQVLTSPPVKRAAETLELPIAQPESIKDEASAERLSKVGADVFVVVAYGKILPKRVLEIPPFGGVNVHASKLPLYRGASPISAAIAAGEKETTVTMMKMDEKMDEGPVLSTHPSVPIDAEDDTETLTLKLARAAGDMIVPTLRLYLQGIIEPKAQDHASATYTAILTREDGRIDWNRSAEEIERHVRAMRFWPEAFTSWARKGGPALKLTIKKASVMHPTSKCDAEGKPGAVCRLADGTLGVNCGTGSLLLQRIQLEGKGEADVGDFLNGYPDFVGAELG